MTKTYLPGFLPPVHTTGSRKGPAQNPRPTEDEIAAQHAAQQAARYERLLRRADYKADPTGMLESSEGLLAVLLGS